MTDGTNESNREELLKLQGNYKASLEKLISKAGTLVNKFRDVSEENAVLKENIKELNNKITEIKLQLTKLNSDSVFKDKEISSLKNMLLNAESNKTSIKDKENVKSRIKELISRIDVHLDQYETQDKELDD